MTKPLFPDIEVKMTGEDGNTGAIMGRVTDAMRHAAWIRCSSRTLESNACLATTPTCSRQSTNM